MSLSVAGATVIGAGISALGGAGSSIASGSMNRKTRKFQREENEKTRQFNAAEAEKAYQRQLEFYDRYETPASKMAMYKEAGLNPDLIYGNALGGSLPSVQSASSSPASTPSPLDVGAGIRDASNQIASAVQNYPLREAQKQNIEADTLKKESEKDVNDSVVLLNGEKIMLTRSQDSLTKEQKNRVTKQISNMDIEADTMRKNLELLDTEIANNNLSADEKRQVIYEMRTTFENRFKQLQYSMRKDLAEAQISEQELDFIRETISDRINIVSQEARQAAMSSNLMQFEVEDVTYLHKRFHDKYGRDLGTGAQILMDMMVAAATSNTALLETQLDLLKDYGDVHAITSIVSQLIGSIGSAAAGVAAMKYFGGKSLGGKPVGFPTTSKSMGTIGFATPH